jgi:hypothetical protein
MRVNMYKDRIKYKGALPAIPGARALAAALAPNHAALAAAAPLAADRPVHVISSDEALAARRFLQVRAVLHGVLVLVSLLCVLSPCFGRQVESLPAWQPLHFGVTGGGPPAPVLAAPRPFATSPCLGWLTQCPAAAPDQVMLEHLSFLCGDLRLHTIVNVGMTKRTGLLLKDALIESFAPRDRHFMRAFLETQMFAVYSDSVIAEYCDEA